VIITCDYTKFIYINSKFISLIITHCSFFAAKRLDGYVRVTLRSNGSIPPPPSGFVDFQEELVAFIASFRRLVSYNHAVFGEHFHKILNKAMGDEETESTTPPTGSGITAGQAQTAKP